MRGMRARRTFRIKDRRAPTTPTQSTDSCSTRRAQTSPEPPTTAPRRGRPHVVSSPTCSPAPLSSSSTPTSLRQLLELPLLLVTRKLIATLGVQSVGSGLARFSFGRNDRIDVVERIPGPSSWFAPAAYLPRDRSV